MRTSSRKSNKIFLSLGFLALGLLVLIIVGFSIKQIQTLTSRAQQPLRGPQQSNSFSIQTSTICQLTGLSSNVTNIKGTDLGSMTIHNGKTYFFFGDTNTQSSGPGNTLSNIVGYQTGISANGCPLLHYISARDLYPTVAVFYAQESALQGKEEIRTNTEIDQNIFTGYDQNLKWAQTRTSIDIMNELNRKYEKILRFYHNRSRTELAAYYAQTATRLNALGFSYRDPQNITTYPRDFDDFNAHYQWALQTSTPIESIISETISRPKVIAAAIEGNFVKQAIPSRTFAGELSLIPTGEFSYVGILYSYFMSVNKWVSPGKWTVNYGGIAISTDNGKTFRRTNNLFSPNSNFVQIVPVLVPGDNTYIYLFGTPAGRFGNLKLARVPVKQITNRTQYQFCKLTSLASPNKQNTSGCTWSNDENQASIVVPEPVGEVSVVWNKFTKQWLLTYLNASTKHLKLRTSGYLFGPWSNEQSLFSCEGSYSGCYGAFIYPTVTKESFTFLTSIWNTYNVYILKGTYVTPKEPSIPPAPPSRKSGIKRGAF